MKTRSRGTICPGIVAVVAAMLIPPPQARAQETPEASPLTVGTRVRVLAPTATGGEPIVGMIIQTDETSLLIGLNDRVPVKVSRQAITQLDVSVGRRGHAHKGLIIGAVVGAAFVAATAALSKDSLCPPGKADTQSCLDQRNAFLVFGIPGLALEGAGVGALIKTDRWSSVPLERARVSLAPTGGHGLGLSLSLRF